MLACRQIKSWSFYDFVVLLQEMFPQFKRLNAPVRTVATGVGFLAGVSHYVELESTSLPESFTTMIAG